MPASTIRHLSDEQVQSLLPPPLVAVELARHALVARARGRAEVPPKPAVALPGGGFANAMPAAVVDDDAVGCKWLTVLPDNPARGLPAIQGLMVVGDATTGRIECVMGAASLTALRTAAVSGACVAALGRPEEPVAFLGTGVQARSHLRVLAALGCPEVRVYGRRAAAREEIERWAHERLPDLRVTTCADSRAAVDGAATVISGLAIGLHGVALDPTWVREDALLLPLDYASSVGADLARTATVVSDDVDQLAAVAPTKLSPDYPPATGWTGDALLSPRPTGRLVCQNLGNGSSDLVVARYVAEQARLREVGTVLPL